VGIEEPHRIPGGALATTAKAPLPSERQSAYAIRLAQVVPVELHDFGPGLDEVCNELGLGILARIHLG
jgi:hypothetical protein